MALEVIILAAGQGVRMHSELPKVLHVLGGKPLLTHVYDLASSLEPCCLSIVYGRGGEVLSETLPFPKACWVKQDPPLGTGHAVMQVADRISDEATVLVLYADVPLLQKSTIEQLLPCVQENTLGIVTVFLPEPYGYGRIIRDESNRIIRIVEEKDATAQERTIQECNTGILAAKGKGLKKWLKQIKKNNAQEEYYLTDIIALAVEDGFCVESVQPSECNEVMGVNQREQLAVLERAYQKHHAQHLMRKGVTLRDPDRFDLRGTIDILGKDIEIDINVLLEGAVSLGNRVKIGPYVSIKDSSLADDVEILSHCVIEKAIIGPGSRIGPFARIRPDTKLGECVHIGNFVEIKHSTVSHRSKINHLSYIGDATIGEGVNIGAGTITCNYDGVNKHPTSVEDGAFIGSNTQLVAPIRIGKNATIGAGSTITHDAPENTLTLSRVNQVTVTGWQRPRKKDE